MPYARIHTVPLSLAAWLVFIVPGLAHTPHDDVFSVALSPDFANDETIYALVRSSVLKSTDGGENWRRMINGLDNVEMLVQMDLSSDGRTLYVSSNGNGVFKSEDAGETWQSVNRGLDTPYIAAVTVAPSNQNVALAAGILGGLYRTVSAGEDWERLEGAFGVVTAMAISRCGQAGEAWFVGDAAGRLFISRDEGLAWQMLEAPSDQGPVTAVALAMDFRGDNPRGSCVLAVGTQGGSVFVSDDGGQTFEVVHAPAAGDVVTALAYSPDYTRDGRLFVATWTKGVYCSRHRGRRWYSCARGLTSDRQAEILGRPSFGDFAVSSEFARDQTIYVAGFDGLFRSRTQGKEWQEIETFPKDYIVGIAASPGFANDQTLLLTSMLWGVYASYDAGESWSSLNEKALVDYPRGNGLTRLFAPVFSPNYAEDGTIFTSTWYKVHKSTSGGRKWRQLEIADRKTEPWIEEHNHQALAVAVSPNYAEDMTLVAGVNWGRIIASTDGGKTFHTLKKTRGNTGAVVFSPAFAKHGVIFAADTEGVYKSSNSGRNWIFTPLTAQALLGEHAISPAYPEDQRSGYEFFLNIERGKTLAILLAISPDFANDGFVFAGTAHGLFRSSNGGRTWSPVTSGTLAAPYYVEALAVSPDFSTDGMVLVAVRGKGLFQSTNRARTFGPLAPQLIADQTLFAHYIGVTPKFPPIIFSPNFARDRTIFGVVGSELYRSSNAGETWTRLDAPKPGLKTRLLTWYVANVSRKTKLAVLAGAVAIAFGVAGFLHRRSGSNGTPAIF